MKSLNPAILNHRFARPIIYSLLIVSSIPILAPLVQSALPYNGFDVEGALVPMDQIQHGGPPRDGIPAINNPEFVSPSDVNFLQDQDRVLGIQLNGVSKAYAIKILNHHEIVNDRFGDRDVVVTFCPLCGTGMAFAAKVNGKSLRFGVSGLLYNSDMLLYDRETASLWSQIMGTAISGPLRGSHLRRLPISHTSWSHWRKNHPATLVLSTNTGHYRNYNRSPYGNYDQSDDVYFPINHRSRRYHPKERVIGIEVGGKFRAYPFVELGKIHGQLNDSFNGMPISISFNKSSGSGKVLINGKPAQQVTAFWFAWYAFHPTTSVFTSP